MYVQFLGIVGFGIHHGPRAVRHHARRADLVLGVIEIALAHAVVFGDEPVPHIDEVLEQHPRNIILPEEVPVKGIEAVVAGAGYREDKSLRTDRIPRLTALAAN